MKNYLLILMILLFANTTNAQNANYNDLWNQVEKFEVDGLPKSALKIVEDIAVKAKKEANSNQIIKSLIFKSKFVLILEEDAQLKIINDFKAEISQSKFPTKNILENLLANLYWQYFQQNRWKFYNRTNTSEKVDTTDFRTWDLQTLFNEISLHFENSLQNGLILQLEKLSKYNMLLTTVEGSKIYRPSLFDFLAHNALTFYKTDENNITKPAYKFELNNSSLLSDSKTFSQLHIISKDTTSLQLKALNLYQELIGFHLKNNSSKALATVNIERLHFVKQHGTFKDKESLLLNTFSIEKNGINDIEVSGLYNYEIASIYYNQSNSYTPKKNETHRWKAKEALEICNAIINENANSDAAKKCADLKQQILQETLQITTENYVPVHMPSKLLVSYKNIDALNFKIYSITHKQLKELNKTYRKEDQLKFIKNLNPVNNWNAALINENDYQKHSVEVVVPNLANGIYIVYSEVANKPETWAFRKLQVTDFALVQKTTEKYTVYQVINRNHGKPISNARVKLSYQKNYRNSISTLTQTTDANGEIRIKKTKKPWYNILVEVTKNDTRSYFGSYYSNPFYKNRLDEKLVNYRSFLFTDRSIYRPGQTVYFKGIVMETFQNKSKVTANTTVFATLHNVNGEKVSELDFETNDFGSFNGEFILPSSGLTGQYYIRTQITGLLDTYSYFSVEEYKRPKFEANFKPITETVKINDSVKVTGEALAYAGSNITDAKVVYRIHRKVQYPRWYFWYRPSFNSEPQEIAHGETTTDASGKFDIMFKALPDTSVDKDSQPIFHYEVTADITDINGETRTATTTVNVGYHRLTANLEVDNLLDKTNKKHELTIGTKNLNGEFVPARGNIKIYKLIAPKSVLRQRPWQAPDYKLQTREAFKELFPHEAYDNENDSRNWKKGIVVFNKSFDTETSKELALGNMKRWESGLYTIVLESQDPYGQIVKDEARITLFSPKDNTLADKQLFSINTNKTSYQPNDTVELTLASAAENITVFVEIEKNKTITNKYQFVLNNNKKQLNIPVTKDDLGGFVVHYTLAAYNSSKTSSITIPVPYPKTDLEIETSTFRDKLQPGTEETWSFKIKGPKGDKVSAELLASMYDASLDQFKLHNWQFNPIYKPDYFSNYNKNSNQSFNNSSFRVYNSYRFNRQYNHQSYDQLNWFGLHFGSRNITIRGYSSISKALSGKVAGIEIEEDEALLEEVVVTGYSTKREYAKAKRYSMQAESVEMDVDDEWTQKNDQSFTDSDNSSEKLFNEFGNDKIDLKNIKIRKNLQETAFFYPNLKTDKNGNVTFSFTTPEALTKWKLQLLAHTKTLQSATKTLETVTQKELMVIPNAPRFLREGDEITFSTKIANISDKALSGQAKLELTDAVTGKDITTNLVSSNAVENFTVDAKGNTQVSWDLTIPDNVQAVQYKVLAATGEFSDGEQNALPVLSNRMLVTETMPMWIKSNQTKTFTLDKLKNTQSTTLKHHKLTLEMTSNPAWYAVQALPYLMEYPYECNEQTFSRYYANALASHIVNSNPRIKEVFDQWKSQDALISNLEKNQELKSLLIQETPWLRDAQSETEQKKRIALLFDLNKMNNELASALQKLKQNQMGNGAWSWFKGGRENRYITQHIITGFGHLEKLNVILNDSEESMIKRAIKYLDKEFIQEYKDIRKYDKDVDLSKDHLSHTQLYYMYMRSFYKNIKASNEVKEIQNYYLSQIKKYWLKRSLYSKGLMALVTNRFEDSKTAGKILKSLKENSITSEELGMYWKENTNSWYWYQAPIETQALMIEAFSEVGNVISTEHESATRNLNDIDNLKIWLLKNKQTNRWKTTKATTEAVYALLLQGSDWLSVTDMVDVTIGSIKVEPSKLDNVKVEAGTGYFKTSWNTEDIKPEMANVTVSKKGDGIAWGGLYWQYFEDLDKITSAETPLQLKKKLFLKTNTDTGEQISEITKDTQLKIGDLVRVRIELRSDRAMEFVHMKDMRAAGFEPVSVLSEYKWQDGLGYYESTKDAATNFFFDYLPKGVYVFEYDLRVNNSGNMSNGITTIQSMYAPEFSSHSEGVRVNIN